MIIDRAGSEYVHIDVTGAPFDAAPLQVSFDSGDTWTDAAWNNAMTSISILVSGPDETTAAGIVLPLGRHPVSVRLADVAEVVIRNTNGIVEVR